MFNTVHLRETRTSMGAHGRRKFILPRKRPRFVFFHDGAVTDSFTIVGVHRILDQAIAADPAFSAAHGGSKEYRALPEGEEDSRFRDAPVSFDLSAVYQAVGAVDAMRSQSH